MNEVKIRKNIDFLNALAVAGTERENKVERPVVCSQRPQRSLAWVIEKLTELTSSKENLHNANGPSPRLVQGRISWRIAVVWSKSQRKALQGVSGKEISFCREAYIHDSIENLSQL